MNLTVHLIGQPDISAGKLDIPVFLHCVGSGTRAVPCSLLGLVAHALPAGCVATGHFGGQWASLYSCIVPVPVRGQYRVLCRGLWRTRCRPVVRQPDISAGKLGISVFLHCAGSGTRAVPCSLPGLVVLPAILPRQSSRPGFPSARSVPLPAMWGSTGFSAWAYGVACHFVRTCGSALGIQFWFMCTLCRPVGQPDISAGKLDIPVFLHCVGSGTRAVPCSLLGLAASIMPPGTVAFFPGKSSLIFRQTRKLYTGSLRNCLPALNRLFFCMSHSIM